MKYYLGAMSYDAYPRAGNLCALDIIRAASRKQAEGKLVELSESLTRKGKRVTGEELAYLGNRSHIVIELKFKKIIHPIVI